MLFAALRGSSRLFAAQILFLIFQQATAQPMSCGWADNSFNGTPENTTNGCLNVQQVLSNCTPVYVRVNFHFFVNTNCDGNLQVTGKAQNTAYETAENLLNDCNSVLANNPIQWNSPGATFVCNPFRYVLAGVYIECQSSADGFALTGLQQDFGVNTDTELNVYIANLAGGTTGQGLNKMASIDWLTAGNLNHEIGHVFSLGHSWLDDGCADTPKVLYSWDSNCDGVLQSNEKNRQCWILLHDNDPLSFADNNGNMVNDCLETPPCSPSPCCDPSFVNNNVMAYNAQNNAYTSCQLNGMLTDLSENDCGFLAQLGGACPPPSAFIGQTPIDIHDTKDCVGCLILSASYNETSYNLKIYEVNGIQETLIYSPGWQNGVAQNFCFKTFGYGPNSLKPNTHYKAVLTVRNACNQDDTDVRYFTTPDATDCETPNPGPSGGGGLQIVPNPTDGTTQLTFIGSQDEVFEAWISSNQLVSSATLFTNFSATSGANTVEVNLSNKPSGSYTVTVLGQHHVYQAHLIKS